MLTKLKVDVQCLLVHVLSIHMHIMCLTSSMWKGVDWAKRLPINDVKNLRVSEGSELLLSLLSCRLHSFVEQLTVFFIS